MRKFRSDINALRALAVALVVLFHFKVPFFEGGFIGVDVFFVISGLLMTQIIVGSTGDLTALANFYKARLTRIYPALAVCIVAVCALALILIDPLQQKRLLEEALYALTFTSNFFYLFNINYFNPDAENRWLLHTWSLSVEWQFYLVFPIYIFLIRRFLGEKRVLAGILLLFLVSLALCLFAPVRNPTRLFYLLPFRAWEMAAGGLAFYCVLKGRLALLATVAAYGIILACAAFFHPLMRWPSAYTIVPAVAAFVILSARQDFQERFAYRFIHPVGIYSYSIYLWHWPIVVYLRYVFPEMSLGLIVGGIVLSVLAGSASYRLVEQPSQRFLKARGLSVSLVAAAAICLVSAGAIVLHARMLAGSGNLYGAPAAIWRSYVEASDDKQDEAVCAGLTGSGELRACRFANDRTPGGSNALLLGDSHAHVWLPRLEEVKTFGPEQKISSATIAVLHGCPSVPRLNMGFRNCAEFNSKALDLAMSGKYDHVVYISLWDYMENDAEKCIVEGEGCVIPASPASYGPLFSEFVDNVRRLTEKGIKVSVFLPPVRAGFETPVELAKRRFLGLDPAEAGAVSRREQEEARRFVMDGLQPPRAMPLVRLVDPFDILCDGESCKFVDSRDYPVLRDSHHLRASYTRANEFLDDSLRW